MPPDMAISMRHTKLKAEEAALLAGELNKPSWESRNEGIHERVSFEDTIWGFDLAGGIFYNTPLRVTFVKPDSRAEKAGIRPGDRLLRINDLDTSTLTIQQAHDIIVDSGIYLKLSVTSPEDDEDSYYCYEDPIIDDEEIEEERRIEEEKAEKRRVSAKVSHYWSLQWPWVSKKRLIYRESNCFMVPSKYEEPRRDKYPPLPVLRFTDDIIHYSRDGNPGNQDNTKRMPSLWEEKENARKARKERLKNADASSDVTAGTNKSVSDTIDDEESVKKSFNRKSRRSILTVERQETINESKEQEEIPRNDEVIEEMNKEINNKFKEEINNEMNEDNNEIEETAAKEVNENNNEVSNDILKIIEENNQATEEDAEVENGDNFDHLNGEINDDDVLNEVMGKPGDSVSRNEEDNNILDSILSDEGQNLESSESNNER